MLVFVQDRWPNKPWSNLRWVRCKSAHFAKWLRGRTSSSYAFMLFRSYQPWSILRWNNHLHGYYCCWSQRLLNVRVLQIGGLTLQRQKKLQVCAPLRHRVWSVVSRVRFKVHRSRWRQESVLNWYFLGHAWSLDSMYTRPYRLLNYYHPHLLRCR